MIDIKWNYFNGSQIFWQKTSGKGIKNEKISNKELEEELHQPNITKFNKIKVRSLFIDNI